MDVPPPPKISKPSHLSSPPPPPEISKEKERSLSPIASAKGGGSQASLSIEETNRLRAKLGLKPLEVESKNANKGRDKEDAKIKDDLGEFYHKPAINTNERAKSQKIREKLTVQREKRAIDDTLAKTKTLGESDSDEGDDANVWVKRNRKLQGEKKKAEERVSTYR